MGCATSTIKYLLFLFNLIFALGGLAILAIGAIIQWNIGIYEGFLEQNVTLPAILLIIVGSIIFIISFFGCCGAVKESHCMITTFAGILLFMFIVQLVGGILVFVYQDDLDGVLRKSMEDLLALYHVPGPDGEFSRNTWDTIQEELKCCGIDGPTDWTLKALGLPGVGIPKLAPPSCSCDQLISSDCVLGYYSQGCFEKLGSWMKMTGNILGGVAIGLAVVELIGVIFAMILASAIKKRYQR